MSSLFNVLQYAHFKDSINWRYDPSLTNRWQCTMIDSQRSLWAISKQKHVIETSHVTDDPMKFSWSQRPLSTPFAPFGAVGWKRRDFAGARNHCERSVPGKPAWNSACDITYDESSSHSHHFGGVGFHSIRLHTTPPLCPFTPRSEIPLLTFFLATMQNSLFIDPNSHLKTVHDIPALLISWQKH
jgi:hypothetical protein